MARKLSIFIFVTVILASVLFAHAQQPGKIPRIGYLTGVSPSTNSARHEAFRQGLRELGYVEGKNIVIDWRSAEGKFDRLPALAAELVRLKVDIIVTGGGATTRAAKEVTTTIPIVMAQDRRSCWQWVRRQPRATWWEHHWTVNLCPRVKRKRLELLKEIVPRLSRVAVLGNSAHPGNAQALREVELAAKAFGVQLQYLDYVGPKDIETAFRAATKGRADAVLILVAGPRRHF